MITAKRFDRHTKGCISVGLSAGSMIMTRFGTTYGNHTLPAETDKSLGLVDFALHPHLDHGSWGVPGEFLANLEKLAATIPDSSMDANA